VDKYVIAEVTADPKDAAAYTANDVVGGLLSFSIADGVKINGGVINSVYLVDDDNEGAALKLYLFSAAPTTIADDAAFAPTAADLKKMFAVVDIASGDYEEINSMKVVYKADVNQIIRVDNKQQVYGYLVCGATPTYAANKTIFIRLSILSES
jgi:hypothetical protein